MKENMLKTNVTEDEYAEIKNYAYNTYLMFKMFDEEHVKQLIGENNPYVNDREKNMIYINTLLIPNDVEFINDMDILKKEELKEKYEVGDITIYQKMLEHHAFEYNVLLNEGKIAFDKKKITILKFPDQNKNINSEPKEINLDIEESIWPNLELFKEEGPRR